MFTLELPGILPNRVNVTVQSTPANVTVESISKEEYLKSGTRGTIIKINFRFSKAGTYQIPALSPMVDWRSRSIKFAPITVYDNPILLEPELTSDLPKTLEVGKPTTFRIYGKFFNELTNISFQLNTKMILKKTMDVNPLPYHIGTFSTETYPLAEFTVIPLEEGTIVFPDIYGLFRSYAGNSVSIPLKSPTVKVVKSTATNTETDNEKLLNQESFLENFPEAFAEEEELHQEVKDFNQETIFEIVKQELINKKLILTIYITVSIIAIILFFLFVLFAFFKRKALSITFLCIFLICSIASVYFLVVKNSSEAISLGSSVRTVPEEKSNTVMQLTLGDKITILDKISEWYLIESIDKRKGWILQSQCVLINQEELEKYSLENQ